MTAHRKTSLPFVLATALAVSFISSGCSVYFAASGSKEPDFTKLQSGAPRLTVEEELGPPIETKSTAKGESALYSYRIGDQPAPGRAMLYLLGDIVTLCLAEYIFFPLEISQSGNAFQAAVEYGKNEKLISLKKIDPAADKSPLAE